MHTVTTFAAAAASRDDIATIVADYLALDRARIVRRLLVARCGALALAAALLGTIVHGFSPAARLCVVASFLAPPIIVWIAELRISRRLSHRVSLRPHRSSPGSIPAE